MSKYQPFAKRLRELFEAARIAYLGQYAILEEARNALCSASAPADIFRAQQGLQAAEKAWTEHGAERVALQFECDSNALADELHRCILKETEPCESERDRDACLEIDRLRAPEDFRRMAERFTGNETMLRYLAHRVEREASHACGLSEATRAELRRIRAAIHLEEDGRERAFTHLREAMQAAAGCDMSIQALRGGAAPMALDEQTEAALAAF